MGDEIASDQERKVRNMTVIWAWRSMPKRRDMYCVCVVEIAERW